MRNWSPTIRLTTAIPVVFQLFFPAHRLNLHHFCSRRKKKKGHRPVPDRLAFFLFSLSLLRRSPKLSKIRSPAGGRMFPRMRERERVGEGMQVRCFWSRFFAFAFGECLSFAIITCFYLRNAMMMVVVGVGPERAGPEDPKSSRVKEPQPPSFLPSSLPSFDLVNLGSRVSGNG